MNHLVLIPLALFCIASVGNIIVVHILHIADFELIKTTKTIETILTPSTLTRTSSAQLTYTPSKKHVPDHLFLSPDPFKILHILLLHLRISSFMVCPPIILSPLIVDSPISTKQYYYRSSRCVTTISPKKCQAKSNAAQCNL